MTPPRTLDDARRAYVDRVLAEQEDASATIVQETIRAVVLAYAEGKITLDPIKKDTPKNQIRHAPSFVQGRESAADSRPYTAATIAGFLKGPGWTQPKIRDFLRLRVIDGGRR